MYMLKNSTTASKPMTILAKAYNCTYHTSRAQISLWEERQASQAEPTYIWKIGYTGMYIQYMYMYMQTANYLKWMAVLSSKLTVGASELVDVGMWLGMTVQHRLVVAAVRTLVALVGPRPIVTAQMVLEVMTQLCSKGTSRTFEHLVCRHVLLTTMYPQLLLQSASASTSSSSFISGGVKNCTELF